MKENRIVPSCPSIARLEEHLSLKSLSARTREEYPRYIRKLAERFGKDPALLEEQDARAYLLYLKEKKNYAPSSMRIAVAAMQMFFGGVLRHDWKLFSIVRCPDLQRLPIVLSREEVRRLLSEVHEPRFRVILQLIYCCGLRVGEAVSLRVRDIHAAEQRIHIREAKGGKDCYVPLPPRMLAGLREFWKTHRHPQLIFPAVGRGWRERATERSAGANGTMSISSIQHCFRLARAGAGIKAEATVHTLRHSYATHLLGLNLAKPEISAK